MAVFFFFSSFARVLCDNGYDDIIILTIKTKDVDGFLIETDIIISMRRLNCYTPYDYVIFTGGIYDAFIIF